MRVALFGCGRIGTVHAESVAAHPRAELAWGLRPDGVGRRRAGRQVRRPLHRRRRGRARRRRDRRRDRRLADRRRTSTCSPAPSAGKAVLCEKPIDFDVARVDACWAEIGSLAAGVMLGFNRRFDPLLRATSAPACGRRHRPPGAAGDHQPGPGAPARRSTSRLRRAVPGHDDPRLRHGPLPARRRRRGQRHGRQPDLALIEEAGDIDGARGPPPLRRRRPRPITNCRRCASATTSALEAFGERRARSPPEPAPHQRPVLGRSRRRCAQRGRAAYLDFFRERYGAAYRAELDHFVTCVESGGTSRSPPSPTAVAKPWCWPTRRTRACGPAARSGCPSHPGGWPAFRGDGARRGGRHARPTPAGRLRPGCPAVAGPQAAQAGGV